MRPEVVRSQPGSCPICGVTLEPREISRDEVNPEPADMSKRLWISVALAAPLLAVMVSELLPSKPLQHLLSATVWAWIEFALASPVVLWCGWPFLSGPGSRWCIAAPTCSRSSDSVLALPTFTVRLPPPLRKRSLLPFDQ